MGLPITAVQKTLFLTAVLTFCVPAQAVDIEAAKSLARRNSCFKCHDEGKDATPFKKIANKYRGDAQAEEKIVKHLASNPEVTFLDGKTKEEHRSVRTDPANDAAQTKNLIKWVLSH
jgi:cytochrome c